MKRQIAGAALIGALVAAGGMLWQEPTFGAMPDVEAAFSPDGGAERLVLRTIYGAQQSVRVMAYSFTAAPVVKALLDAKRRGVDIAVTVDYRSNIDEDRSGKAAAALRARVYVGIPVRVVRAYAMQHDNRNPQGCYMAVRACFPESAKVADAFVLRQRGELA